MIRFLCICQWICLCTLSKCLEDVFSFCRISSVVITSVSAEKLTNMQSQLFAFSFNRVKIFLQHSCEIPAITL